MSNDPAILTAARRHSMKGSGDDVSKNFGAKVFGFSEFLFFENHGFCFWKLSVFEIRKVLEVQKNTP